jgi:hypothetical protein
LTKGFTSSFNSFKSLRWSKGLKFPPPLPAPMVPPLFMASSAPKPLVVVTGAATGAGLGVGINVGAAGYNKSIRPAKSFAGSIAFGFSGLVFFFLTKTFGLYDPTLSSVVQRLSSFFACSSSMGTSIITIGSPGAGSSIKLSVPSRL